MINKFYFAGLSSADVGIYISGDATFNAPERDIEKVNVPGRNGSLIIDRGRFKNISVSYPAFIRTKFQENAAAARAWLMAGAQYQRLEDTYHPDQYRMARFSGPIDFDMRFLNRSGEVKLTFDCKPQRFQVAGEAPICYFEPGLLNNLYRFAALPLIKVYGSGAGTLTVGQRVVDIKALDEWVMLDSDTQNAYKGTINKNGSIYAPEFPTLEPGDNVIAWSGGIEKIEITPRWWTL